MIFLIMQITKYNPKVFFSEAPRGLPRGAFLGFSNRSMTMVIAPLGRLLGIIIKRFSTIWIRIEITSKKGKIVIEKEVNI